MIALQRFAKKSLFRQYLWGVTRPNSSPNLNMYIISREWRKLLAADTQESKEKAALDILIAVFSFLAKIGCENIEEKLWLMVNRKHFKDEPSFQLVHSDDDES